MIFKTAATRSSICRRASTEECLYHHLTTPRIDITQKGRAWVHDIRIIEKGPKKRSVHTRSAGNVSPATGHFWQMKNTSVAHEGFLPPAPTDLLELYRGLVASGRLKWDDEQVRCLMKLRQLLKTLENYSPPIELVAKLTPTAPYIAQSSQSTSWWNAKATAGEALGLSNAIGGEEQKLVKVLSGEEELANLTTPKGILLTGPPGSGKSILLSLFFQLLPIPKRRVHYHAFTLALYRQVFLEINRKRSSEEKEIERKISNKELAGKRGWRAVFAGGRWDEEGKERLTWAKEEGLAFNIARKMILQYTVLYFDEFQLIDASSAALIRDVLSWYWRLGGVIVTCSNRVPEDLYHHGVQRERLAGFLDALKARCEIALVDGGRDWRRGVENGTESRWFQDQSTQEFEAAWEALTKGQNIAPRHVTVYGRTLNVPVAAGNACRFTFAELCEQALGPADYLAIVSTFGTVFLDDVPTLYLRHKNEARRLVNLIDALYESRCQLYLRSPSTPTTLFFSDALTLSSEEEEALTNERMMTAESLSATIQVPYRPNTSYYNDLTPAQRDREATEAKRRGSSFSVLGIWTGEDEKFAYKRAVSRLVEMTSSVSYAAEPWCPLEASLRSWESLPNEPGRVLLPESKVEAPTAEDNLQGTPAIGKAETTSTSQKKAPPDIGEQHIWAVVDEWGGKAGRWGQGVRAFSPDPKSHDCGCDGKGCC